MALETSPGSGHLAALFPPGNVAAEIQALRRRILTVSDTFFLLPFPCAAPLAWFESFPEPGRLENLADKTALLYDRYRVVEGILFLGPENPSGSAGSGGSERGADGVPGPIPLPTGAGFPLARLSSDAVEPSHTPAKLPEPPRIAFRTFQAILLRLRWGKPWFSALSWEAVESVRFPIRRAART